MERDASALGAAAKARKPVFILLGVVMVFFCPQSVLAEPGLQPEVLEALKNNRQQRGNCQSQPKLAVMPLAATAVPVMATDMSCALPAADVYRRLKDPDLMLIDTRPASEFSGSHIQGALQLTAGELARKPYLANKSVILIGNGKAERELYSQCQKLKQGGFRRVHVLWGGMPAWLSGDFGVEGLPDRSDLSVRLTAGEFWLESQFKDNLVVVAQTQGSFAKQLPGSHLLPDAKPASIKSALKRYVNKPPAALILATSPTTDIQAIRQTLKPVPLLVYTEGAEAFSRQLREQRAIWEAYVRGPRQPLACKRQSAL